MGMTVYNVYCENHDAFFASTRGVCTSYLPLGVFSDEEAAEEVAIIHNKSHREAFRLNTVRVIPMTLDEAFDSNKARTFAY